MEFDELLKLKSGTDIRGTAMGDNITLTNEAVNVLVKAFAAMLYQRTDKRPLKVAVGADPRISSGRIAAIATKALLSCGIDVIYTGLSTTPSMFILLKESSFGCDASIMITASHLPSDKNGLKFFTCDGGLSSAELDELIQIADSGEFPSGSGRYFKRSFMSEYAHILVGKVENQCGFLPLKGKKIIVDAGNGMGGFFVKRVLNVLGADTEGSLYLDPDGRFPNHIPNPEDRAAIKCLSRAVTENKADLGIIFDTDVDRAACVDSDGTEINRNNLVALLAAIILPEKGGVIVTDSVTSTHLTDFIRSLGGDHLRYKRGYKNVIDKCAELNAAGIYSPIAIETSGHAAFPENYYLDDGAYLVIKILCALASSKKTPSELIAGLKHPAEEDEVRITFNEYCDDYRFDGGRVIEGLRKAVKSIPEIKLGKDFEGVRMEFDGRWALVRMSVHDPVMAINFESDFKGGNILSAEMLEKLLSKYRFLDLTNLKKFIFQ